MTSHVWSGAVWQLPSGTNVEPGTFLFSTDGALAGLVSRVGETLALVPGGTVMSAAERLRQENYRDYGELGITVQPLTPGVASSTRAQSGVVVTSVDPQGPAAGRLDVADVIVGVGDEPLSGYEHWHAIAARALAGQAITLRVQRDGDIHAVAVTAAPMPAPSGSQPLGLSLRRIPRVGVEVLDVAPRSAAAAAGIRPADVITLFGDRKAPTQTEVRESFAAAPADRPLLVALTRGSAHHVLTIDKR
jgi:serine protease Do